VSLISCANAIMSNEKTCAKINVANSLWFFCIKVGVVQNYTVSKFFLIRNNDEMLNF